MGYRVVCIIWLVPDSEVGWGDKSGRVDQRGAARDDDSDCGDDARRGAASGRIQLVFESFLTVTRCGEQLMRRKEGSQESVSIYRAVAKRKKSVALAVVDPNGPRQWAALQKE